VLPIQDAVPSGSVAWATIALIIINGAAVAGHLHASAFPTALFVSPFLHPSWAHFVVTVWFLWLFGDNVEARLGRALFTVLYIASAAAGTYVAHVILGSDLFLGAACGVSGVIGAYFVLLPKSRVLVLVPIPLDLAETPALFFLGLWWLFHVVALVAGPWAAPSLLWPLITAALIGAAVGLVRRASRQRATW
jgi:membrane associated rhomboid family serine protease